MRERLFDTTLAYSTWFYGIAFALSLMALSVEVWYEGRLIYTVAFVLQTVAIGWLLRKDIKDNRWY